ncbi:hypothetical protein [Algoriphagus mannitolivorans]|uniref:hypothetical protein n=1 Tax=Algoriphagus mannitolivorans TaxID=226504 RepID=UPI000407C507|nr:hypothetical protein [Algoriphagus mannitolivorans]
MDISNIQPNSSIPSSGKSVLKALSILWCMLFLSACNLFKSEVKEYLFQFNSADGSLEKIIADGVLTIDGVQTGISTSNIQELSVSNEFIYLTMTVGGDTYYFKTPNNGRSLDLVDNYLDNATTFLSNIYRPISGVGGVSSYTVSARESDEGSGSFTLVATGEFRSNAGGSIKDLVFIFDIDFDTSRTGGIAGGGGSSGGGSGGSGGGSGACVNEIKAPTLVSYWDQIKPGSATGTGKKVAANTIFSTYTASDVALVIDGTSGSTRYVVQIMFTGSNLVANKTINFQNAGTGTGLTSSGAVGRLIAINGTVNDDWRTNRDFGKNKNMGTLTIKTISPKITGTYSFDASGDGYPSLNNQFAKVSGSFCIDP